MNWGRWIRGELAAPVAPDDLSGSHSGQSILWYIPHFMTRSRRLRRALPCALVFAALSAIAGPTGKEPAPRFTATTTGGEKFSNASVKGKVVLLDFWTTWCPYCKEEGELVDKLGHEFADKGLIVLAINVAESKKKVKQYLERHPRSSRIVLMEDTNLAAMYQATVYPIYVVIDREGNIAGEQRGAGGEGALRRLLARAGLASKDEEEDSGVRR
jgi:thiol-disulfide isomerase/thioredoxin